MNLVSRKSVGLKTTAARMQPAASQSDRARALDQSTIAEMSAETIQKMCCEELVQVIRTAEVPLTLRPDLEQRLPYFERETLRRLAYLARRYCQKRRE